MRVLVCGSRTFSDRELFNRTLDEVHGGEPTRNIRTLIHGGARGADSMCWGWVLSRNHGCCNERQLGCDQYLADWDKHGKAAGIIRNTEMLEKGKPDLVIAFWDGKSPGTKNMISQAEKAGVPVKVVYVQGSEQTD